MRRDRRGGEADPAQDEFAGLALELSERGVGQGRHLRQARGGKHADRVVGKPEEITRRCLAWVGVAGGDRTFERGGENRNNELFDLVEQDLGEFSIFKMAGKRQPQLLIGSSQGGPPPERKRFTMPRTKMTSVAVEGRSARNCVRPGSASQTSARIAA